MTMAANLSNLLNEFKRELHARHDFPEQKLGYHLRQIDHHLTEALKCCDQLGEDAITAGKIEKNFLEENSTTMVDSSNLEWQQLSNERSDFVDYWVKNRVRKFESHNQNSAIQEPVIDRQRQVEAAKNEHNLSTIDESEHGQTENLISKIVELLYCTDQNIGQHQQNKLNVRENNTNSSYQLNEMQNPVSNVAADDDFLTNVSSILSEEPESNGAKPRIVDVKYKETRIPTQDSEESVEEAE